MGFLSKLQTILQGDRVNLTERFELLRRAISGTMSKFYMAHDRFSDEIVGLKIADKQKVASFEARFKGLNKPSEGEIAIKLKHPLVVETFEHGLSTDGSPFMVMEFLDGPGLQFLLKRNDPSIEGCRFKIIRQMAEGLQYVHEQGFIHRDVCPRNFIYDPRSQTAKMIDFGLTLPSSGPYKRPGNRTGTPLYMSPEVVRRRSTDHRLDVFSFGVSAYQVCTYELPWPVSETTGRAALAHDTDAPTDIRKYRSTLNRDLAEAIMKCLEPDRKNRPATMEEFLKVIENVTQDDEG